MSAILTHPLGSSRFSSLVSLIRRYGCEPRYLPNLAAIGCQSLLRQPFMCYEQWRYGEEIASQELPKSPVFIIGHWRSGTTHLQNILSHDPQFASITLNQAAMPLDFLTFGKWISAALEKSIPNKRLMDNVAVSSTAPWEEEIALVATTTLSFYHVSFFPDAVDEIFDEAILFRGRNEQLIEQWKARYMWFLKKHALVSDSNTLLLKNPANTARIDLLLELFPDARFIHIHRNPYEVFRSTVHLYYEAQKEWGLHTPERQKIIEHVLQSYPKLMRAYQQEHTKIPAGRLAEVRFEDLECNPLETIEAAYRDSGITNYAEAKPHFESYLSSIQGYQKNAHELPNLEVQLVGDQWAEWFTYLGYNLTK